MNKIKRGVYRIVYFFVKLFYPRIQTEGASQLPQEPCVLVGNHAKMNGPITATMYIPGQPRIWCAQEMMQLKEVPAYAYQDFWSRKPGWCRWFYKLLSYLIAPLSVCIFNTGPSIPVYRDSRVTKTFRQTVDSLKEGRSVVIFPEHDAPYNHILCDFQQGFVDVARRYYKETGKSLPFVPMYLTPGLKKLCFGSPVFFDPTAPIREERQRICDELMQQITQMAQALPRHKVIPYNNLPKRNYAWNREEEGTHEKAGG